MMKAHKPLFWWAERGHISKSIGPFLRKRMLETHTFCSLIEMQPIADKQTRAQSIQGRLSMNRVRFPERAPWWPAARDQMLKFPYDAHDDFVDTLAYIGLGLTLQVGASVQKDPIADKPPGKHLRLAQDAARPGRAQRETRFRLGRLVNELQLSGFGFSSSSRSCFPAAGTGAIRRYCSRYGPFRLMFFILIGLLGWGVFGAPIR